MMDDRVSITLTSGKHAGVYYFTTADRFDRAIARHLPGSPYSLRQKIDKHPANTEAPGHFDDLITVTELLFVLAWLDDRPTD